MLYVTSQGEEKGCEWLLEITPRNFVLQANPKVLTKKHSRLDSCGLRCLDVLIVQDSDVTSPESMQS